MLVLGDTGSGERRDGGEVNFFLLLVMLAIGRTGLGDGMVGLLERSFRLSL